MRAYPAPVDLTHVVRRFATRETGTPQNMKIGYRLASEEQGPKPLVDNAVLAERAGFEHLLISDHIHPWVEDLRDQLALGDDPGAWREKIEAFEQAGFTHVALHNVAEEQSAFIEFAGRLV